MQFLEEFRLSEGS